MTARMASVNTVDFSAMLREKHSSRWWLYTAGHGYVRVTHFRTCADQL